MCVITYTNRAIIILLIRIVFCCDANGDQHTLIEQSLLAHHHNALMQEAQWNYYSIWAH